MAHLQGRGRVEWSPDRRCTRRLFLGLSGRCALFGGTILSLGSLFPWLDAEAADPAELKEVAYYEKRPDKTVACLTCPRKCTLKPGRRGYCRTKENVGGRLLTHAWNNPCIVRMDKIEKTPFNHYYPGSDNVSLAIGGCNLRCKYCQNWQQSQSPPEALKTFELDSDKAVSSIAKQKARLLVFTYTEPMVYAEYVLAVARAARKKNIRTAVATAGFIRKKPLTDAAEVVDAFAVGLKGFEETFYKNITTASLKPVLDTLVHLKSTRAQLEVVNLVLPTYNDDLKTVRKMARWLVKNLGEKTPLHFERFVPQYQLKNLPKTPIKTLEACRAEAMDAGLKYVYLSNVAPHEASHTYCPKCRKKIIMRLGFKLLEMHLDGNKCKFCDEEIPGRFEKTRPAKPHSK